MIEAELRREEGVLVVSPAGPLEKADFERLALLVDPYIEEHGRLKGIMIYVKSFPGWEDFSALVTHLRFIDDHQEKVGRVAAVTDSTVLSILPRLGDHFVAADVRHFPYEEHQQALEWLASGG